MPTWSFTSVFDTLNWRSNCSSSATPSPNLILRSCSSRTLSLSFEDFGLSIEPLEWTVHRDNFIQQIDGVAFLKESIRSESLLPPLPSSEADSAREGGVEEIVPVLEMDFATSCGWILSWSTARLRELCSEVP